MESSGGVASWSEWPEEGDAGDDAFEGCKTACFGGLMGFSSIVLVCVDIFGVSKYDLGYMEGSRPDR